MATYDLCARLGSVQQPSFSRHLHEKNVSFLAAYGQGSCLHGLSFTAEGNELNRQRLKKVWQGMLCSQSWQGDDAFENGTRAMVPSHTHMKVLRVWGFIIGLPHEPSHINGHKASQNTARNFYKSRVPFHTRKLVRV